jgi:hypothetical protein
VSAAPAVKTPTRQLDPFVEMIGTQVRELGEVAGKLMAKQDLTLTSIVELQVSNAEVLQRLGALEERFDKLLTALGA